MRNLMGATVVALIACGAVAPAAHAQFPNLNDLGKVIVLPPIPPIPPIGGGKGQQSNPLEMAKALELANTLAAKPTDPNMSQSQQQIHSYTKQNYQMQGAAGGAALLAIVGCLVADYVMDSSCTKGAIVGGLAGGVIGYVVGGNVADRQEVYASKEANLGAKLTAAEQDLADAKATRLAAEDLVKEHRATLDGLRREVARDKSKQNKMALEVSYMIKDAETLKTAKRGIEGQLASLQTAIANTPKQADASKLQAVHVQLQAEDRALDAALNNLGGVIESAKI